MLAPSGPVICRARPTGESEHALIVRRCHQSPSSSDQGYLVGLIGKEHPAAGDLHETDMPSLVEKPC